MSESFDGEPVLMREAASRLAVGLNLMGGMMVLTSRRLVFVPLISRSALQSSSRAAKYSKQLHDWSLHPQKLLNMAIMPLTKPIDIPLAQITDVTPTRRCALRISWSDSAQSRTMEFAVFATLLTWIWNPENVVHRDQLLTAINDASGHQATSPGTSGH
jgi:hypothetical protein